MLIMLSRAARLLAEALEVVSARIGLRKAPTTIDESLDFAQAFRRGATRIDSAQVRSEIAALLAMVAAERPARVLEIGTARGGTLFLFARAATPDATLVTVDLPDGPFGGGHSRLARFVFPGFRIGRQRIVSVRGNSRDPETVARVKSAIGGPVDFLFIDGDHTHDGVSGDFQLYGPLVRENGLVAFHDIVDGPFSSVGDVPRFWRELKARLPGIELVEDPGQGGFGIGVIRLDEGARRSESFRP